MGTIIDGTDALASTKSYAQLDAFVAVVSAGSFTLAARRTHCDKSLLSRRVRALEQALGIRLLNRTTRTLHVTEAGQALYSSVIGPMEQVARALVEVSEGDTLQGPVRMSTIPQLSGSVVIPVVARLRREHPEVQVRVQAREEIVDMVGQGLDVALRTGNLPDSNLVARRVGGWSYVLCATPQWVEEHQPQHPQDLAPHWVLYADVPRADQWALQSGDERCALRVGSVLSTNNGWVVREAVRSGLGVSGFPPFIAAELIERGDLVRVLPKWSVSGRHGIYAVYPHRGMLPRRVQVLIERLTAQVALVQPQWDALSQ
ncbi:MAG: LysR family transcriptional regulator [Deltaproteobacteria bacterium]|nr:LysR family transcriptional regulator [Deltaproteobacteria bacterium]